MCITGRKANSNNNMKLGDSRMTLCDDMDLIWTHEFTSLGINYNILGLNKITKLNLKPKILEMEKLSSIWKCRNLTMIGKTTIIKTLMISKIIHILLSLPRPSEEPFKDIENIFKILMAR